MDKYLKPPVALSQFPESWNFKLFSFRRGEVQFSDIFHHLNGIFLSHTFHCRNFNFPEIPLDLIIAAHISSLGGILWIGSCTSTIVQPSPPTSEPWLNRSLECRKWGFKRWGLKEIRGYLRKKAFFLRFLDFPGAVWALRKRAKKAEKGRKRPISADFRKGRPDTP